MDKDRRKSLNVKNIEAFNSGDWERMKKCLSANVVYEDMPSKRRLDGADQFVEEYRSWKNAAPHCKGKVINSFTTGSTVIVEANWKGTNTGPLGGQPSTGRVWDVNGCRSALTR